MEGARPPELERRGFFCPKMKQVIAFIDGFNLYHTILKVDDGRYRWLDVKGLCQSFLKKDTEVLATVYYFTAFAEWNPRRLSGTRPI